MLDRLREYRILKLNNTLRGIVDEDLDKTIDNIMLAIDNNELLILKYFYGYNNMELCGKYNWSMWKLQEELRKERIRFKHEYERICKG